MQLLTKYKGLVFHDPEKEKTLSVFDGNLEFQRGRKGGWFVIGVCSNSNDNDNNDEPFSLEIVINLIKNTQQEDGIKIVEKDYEMVLLLYCY